MNSGTWHTFYFSFILKWSVFLNHFSPINFSWSQRGHLILRTLSHTSSLTKTCSSSNFLFFHSVCRLAQNPTFVSQKLHHFIVPIQKKQSVYYNFIFIRNKAGIFTIEIKLSAMLRTFQIESNKILIITKESFLLCNQAVFH